MQVIGIVGGIASGKSAVAEHFRRLGAEIVQADLMGHEVLREAELKRAIRDRWGEAVFDANGNVDRASVASIVFAPPPKGPNELACLEQITHPRIGTKLREHIAELSRRDGLKAVVLDAAVLFEAGWDVFCDKIVFVEAPRRQRRQRALQRGWSEAEFSAREAAQESLDDKRKRADWVISNSGSSEDTFAQVRQIWYAFS